MHPDYLLMVIEDLQLLIAADTKPCKSLQEEISSLMSISD